MANFSKYWINGIDKIGTNGLTAGTLALLVMNHLFYVMEMHGAQFFPPNMTPEEKITVI